MREAIDADKKHCHCIQQERQVCLFAPISMCQKQRTKLIYAAYVEGGEGALGVKIVSVYPENIKKNLPSVPATMIVLDPETGMVSACLDGTYLTQLRTGAVQGRQQNFLQKKMLKSAR